MGLRFTARGTAMAKSIKLTLTEDEAEILVDALEADMEGSLSKSSAANKRANFASVIRHNVSATPVRRTFQLCIACLSSLE